MDIFHNFISFVNFYRFATPTLTPLSHAHSIGECFDISLLYSGISGNRNFFGFGLVKIFCFVFRCSSFPNIFANVLLSECYVSFCSNSKK